MAFARLSVRQAAAGLEILPRLNVPERVAHTLHRLSSREKSELQILQVVMAVRKHTAVAAVALVRAAI